MPTGVLTSARASSSWAFAGTAATNNKRPQVQTRTGFIRGAPRTRKRPMTRGRSRSSSQLVRHHFPRRAEIMIEVVIEQIAHPRHVDAGKVLHLVREVTHLLPFAKQRAPA